MNVRDVLFVFDFLLHTHISRPSSLLHADMMPMVCFLALPFISHILFLFCIMIPFIIKALHLSISGGIIHRR